MRSVLAVLGLGSPGKKATIIRLIIAGLICVGLGWLAGRGLDWEVVLDTLAGVPPHVIVLSLAVFLLSNMIRAYRWQVLFIEESISVRRLFLIENMGSGHQQLPARPRCQRGHPVRAAHAPRQHQPRHGAGNPGHDPRSSTCGLPRSCCRRGCSWCPARASLRGIPREGLVISILLVGLVHFLAWGGRGLGFVERFPHLGHILRRRA